MTKSSGLKLIGVEIPVSIIKRLELESCRTGATRRAIIERALDKALPRNIHIVVDRDPDGRPND